MIFNENTKGNKELYVGLTGWSKGLIQGTKQLSFVLLSSWDLAFQQDGSRAEALGVERRAEIHSGNILVSQGIETLSKKVIFRSSTIASSQFKTFNL